MTYFNSKQFSENWTNRAIFRVDRDARKEVFANLIPKDVTKVLEVGCNAGYNLISMYFNNNDYDLTGIDNLKYAIDESKKRWEKFIKFFVADARDIPFPDNSFDLVLTSGLLGWIKYNELSTVINELTRVSNRYVLAIDHAFVGDIKPFLEFELIVSYRGKPLYIVRKYDDYFPGCKVIKHIDRLPVEFSGIPMSAWLFEKI